MALAGPVIGLMVVGHGVAHRLVSRGSRPAVPTAQCPGPALRGVEGEGPGLGFLGDGHADIAGGLYRHDRAVSGRPAGAFPRARSR